MFLQNFRGRERLVKQGGQDDIKRKGGRIFVNTTSLVLRSPQLQFNYSFDGNLRKVSNVRKKGLEIFRLARQRKDMQRVSV